MRRAIVLLMIGLLAAPVFAMSVKGETRPVQSFDSIPMLQTYYDESDDGNMAFWDACTVSLLTISQGDPIYSWFGHSGLRIQTPNGQDYTFDYGNFSFDREDFIRNFVFGRLWFVCFSTYAELEFNALEADDRSASQVVLPLTAEQKKALIGFLNANIRAENRTYLYHHYKDNCATRLRDIIDWMTGGAFQAWARQIDGYSFRKQASRALSNNPAVQWGLEFLQSGNIDKDATLWDEMFLPDMLEKGVMEYFGLESKLVVDNTGHRPAPAAEPQSNMLFSVALGLVLGILALASAFVGKGRLYSIYTAIVDLALGILGGVLLFMMLFTNHDVTWMNENIIFANPLLLVMSVVCFVAISEKRRGAIKAVGVCHAVLLDLTLVLVLLKIAIPSVFLQYNWSAIATFGLYYLFQLIAFAVQMRRKNSK